MEAVRQRHGRAPDELRPPGSLVFDPFCGSGTTGVAALRRGSRFIGIDNDWSKFEPLAQRVADLERRLESERERWLTVEEASANTGRSVESNRHLISLGRIPAHKVEGRWQLSTRELDDWMRSR